MFKTMVKSILMKSLLLGGVVLAAAACSNEKLSGTNADETLGSAKINIVLKAPSAEGVVVKGTVADELDERTINYLNVYLFEEGSSNNENNYTLRSMAKFTTDGSDGSIMFAPGTDAQSTTTCSLDIPASLMGKKVRIGIIANDTPADVTVGSTTLAAFRNVLATATLTDEDTDGTQVKADALVGGETKSFPMSVITPVTEALTPYGLDVSAELVRTVSRIDICNYAPDLIITGVQITGANDKSYLNAGSSAGINVPSTAATSLTINPLSEYQTLLAKSSTVNGASVKGIAYDDSQDESGDAETIKKLNTHRALYLYEQDAKSLNPAVKIDYTVIDGATQITSSVTVEFNDGTQFVNATRNHLYTIMLGDGTAVMQGQVKVSFKVAEWIEGESIDTDLNLQK